MRYPYLRTILAAGALALAASAQAGDLTVIDWGGAIQSAHRQAMYEPFIKASGKPLVAGEWNGEMAKISTMVESNTVSWDLVQLDGAEMLQGCEAGLFEKPDWARLGFKPEVIDGAAAECGVGTLVWAMGLGYNAARLAEAPKGWADFWDVKKFPGKRGLRKRAEMTLEIALLADGVPAKNVYALLATREGVDRAFRKLDAIKPHIQW